MKNLLYGFGLFLLGVFLTGCNSKPRIGFLMDTLKIERWNKDKSLFLEKVDSLGGIVYLEVAEGDPELQTNQAKKLLNQGIDVLVVIPVDLDKAREIVRLAHQKGVKVISYDRMIKNCQVDYYISMDNINIGELQADYLSRLLQKGKFALVGGSINDYNAYLLHLGWMNVLQPLIERGDIEIVYDDYSNGWTQEEGYRMVHEFLKTHPKGVDAIIAGNDALASGAIQALEENGLLKTVLVAGQDADVDALKNILEGNQTITVYKPIEALANATATIALQIAKKQVPVSTQVTINNGRRLVPSILLPSQIVNKNNIKMTVISEGYVSEQEIFK
jgi:D-xylose transport system substrate-binding protein